MQTNLEAAEVKYISFKDDNVEGLWSIRCRLLSDKGSNAEGYAPIVARPVDASFKRPPLVGEVVLLLKAPNSISSKNQQYVEYYYIQTLNIHSSVHHNGLPTIGKTTKANPTGNTQDYQSSQTAPNRNTDSPEENLKDFPEDDEIRPLQPYIGDTLIEGRFGQSIRMGSTITENSDLYSTETFWEAGSGTHGDPITVIRNGQKVKFSVKPDKNKFINENINFDDSSLYLTSTQKIAIAKPTGDTLALDNVGLTKTNFDGKQAILTSDRILITSRTKETLIFSGGGIALSSPIGITLDTSAGVHLAGNVINLGVDAKTNGEPAVLGETTKERLDAMADTIKALCDAIAKLTVPTGVGPSGIPVNVADFNKIGGSDVTKLKQEHDKIKSKYVFLNKDPDYTSTNKADTPTENT